MVCRNMHIGQSGSLHLHRMEDQQGEYCIARQQFGLLCTELKDTASPVVWREQSIWLSDGWAAGLPGRGVKYALQYVEQLIKRMRGESDVFLWCLWHPTRVFGPTRVRAARNCAQ